MQFQVKTKQGIVKRNLRLVKSRRHRYIVRVDDQREIGTVWKDWGRVSKFRRHRLDGTHEVDRWFAETSDGLRIGRKSPYDEGFSTRTEAVTELLEEVLKLRRA